MGNSVGRCGTDAAMAVPNAGLPATENGWQLHHLLCAGHRPPSGHREVRLEPRTFGLRTRHEGEAEADGAHNGSGKHSYG
jgi:hypothetical protein